MGSNPTVSQQKLLAAAGGNSDLLELLQQFSATTQAQQAVTGTAPVSGSAAVASATAKVPPQATGSVSVLAGTYTIQIVNPGATAPLSQLQAAEAGRNATSLTPLQPVTAIYHQLRASTSPAFNVNSNTMTLGGDTGTTQTYWTLTNLGSGTWYFQFRSSYDGVNFNTWKNANSGAGLGGLVDQVTLIPADFSDWALFSLPGSEIMGVCEGFLSDQEQLGIPSGYNLYSSGLLAIAGPNGFTNTGEETFGITLCDVDILEPTSGLAGITGVPDFPVEIRMQYGQRSSRNKWPGTASVFGVAFDPEGENVTLYEQGGTNGAVWAVFTLPGGCQLAVGQGQNSDGSAIWVPPSLTWLSASRMISITAVTDGTDTGNGPHGIYQNQLSGLTLEAKYNDGSTTWSTQGHWLAFAWPIGANTYTTGPTTFVEIALQGGHKVAFGAGQVASGTAITLPAGYTADQMLTICTPASFNDAGHVMAGVGQCSFDGLTPILAYIDGSGDSWDGNVNYMLFVWK